MKEMLIHTNSTSGYIEHYIKGFVELHVPGCAVTRHRFISHKNELVWTWKFRCPRSQRGCKFRAKGTVMTNAKGEILNIYTIGDRSNHGHQQGARGLSDEVKEFLSSNNTRTAITANSQLVNSFPGQQHVTLQQVQYFFNNHKTRIKRIAFAHTIASWQAYCDTKPWSPHSAWKWLRTCVFLSFYSLGSGLSSEISTFR